MIYTIEGFSKVDKHRCCNTTFVNAFPNTIREVCNRVLGRMIFFENHTGREIADWTYLNVGGAVFARLFQGSSKPPVKRRWDGSYPYTSYPHLCYFVVFYFGIFNVFSYFLYSFLKLKVYTVCARAQASICIFVWPFSPKTKLPNC